MLLVFYLLSVFFLSLFVIAVAGTSCVVVFVRLMTESYYMLFFFSFPFLLRPAGRTRRRSSEKQTADKQKASINTTPVSKPSRFDAPSEESAEEMAMVNMNRMNKYENQSPYK